MEKKNFPALTGLRFIAALMVFLHHNNYEKKEGVLFNITNELHIGVTIFFVLSGFLITYRYYNTEKILLKPFFINRFARIYPVYFVLTTITFIILYYQKTATFVFTTQLYFCNITFLRGLSDQLKFTGIGPGWTLTVEEMFYIATPLLFYFLRKNKKKLFVLPFVFLLLGLLITYLSTSYFKSIFFDSYLFLLDFTFFGRSFEFFVGIALAFYIFKNGNQSKFKWMTYFGIMMMLLSVYFLIFIKDLDGNQNRFWSIIFNNYLIPVIAVAPLLYGLMTEKTIVSRLLESKLVQQLGKSSYVFYLIHTGFFYIFLNDFVQNRLFQFIFLNLLSVFIYLFFEKPVNLYIRNKASQIAPKSIDFN